MQQALSDLLLCNWKLRKALNGCNGRCRIFCLYGAGQLHRDILHFSIVKCHRFFICPCNRNALYNGQRGKYRLGWVFYLYYPIHLVILYAVSYLL